MHVLRISLVLLAVAICGAAAAVEPRPGYEDSLGNPEEPALRPYKAFVRGLFAIPYHVVTSTVDGCEKVPVLGVVESARGLRRGAVELTAGTYHSMAGALPREVDEQGDTNQFLNEEPVLGTVADGAVMVPFAEGVLVAPFVVGQVAVDELAEEDEVAEDIEPIEPAVEETAVSKAQRRYLGKPRENQDRTELDGDLLKWAKRHEAVDQEEKS